MKRITLWFGIVCIFLLVPLGISFSQDASLEESCNDCQYKIVDKACLKIEIDSSGGLKNTKFNVKSGHRDTCKDGTGSCQSTSCK
jgi:hypothetical protein